MKTINATRITVFESIFLHDPYSFFTVGIREFIRVLFYTAHDKAIEGDEIFEFWKRLAP